MAWIFQMSVNEDIFYTQNLTGGFLFIVDFVGLKRK
jgi:hypothetical protein